MITDELYNKILEKIREEIKDTKEYQNMRDVADGYTKVALNGIISDEKSHAKYLINALEIEGKQVPDDICSSYSELAKPFRRN